MTIETVRVDDMTEVKEYTIRYPITAYTFPQEARIHRVRIDDEYLHFDLTDKRILSIPLFWIPSVYNAAPEHRNQFEINARRTMVIWNPDKCGINDELRLEDYLGPVTIEKAK